MLEGSEVTTVEWLIAPLRYPFMVRALVASTLVGGLSAVVGTFVVLRSMTFLGDAIAHSVLPGIAAGVLVSGRGDRRTLFWWALGTAVLVTLGIGWVHERGRVREDAAIGIVFAGMFALGIALLSTVRGFSVDLVHILFGNVLAVSSSDLVLIAGFGGGVLLILGAFYREFVLVSFDPILGATLRLPVRLYRYALLVLTAVTVVVSLQVVGLALMLAMLVAPPSTALLLTRRVPATMAIAALCGVVSGLVGLYLSFYFSVASGAAIVLVAIGLFLLALLVTRRRVVFARLRTR
ncbi:MAG: metal ABC transporter permease [Candidatus Bipolaricaulota bacterium]